MAFNPLSYLTKKKEEQSVKNMYDDGSVWSAPTTQEESKANRFVGLNTSRYSPLSGFTDYFETKNNDSTFKEDKLQSPRNQMNYYSKQLGKLGVEVEEPDSYKKKETGGGIGDILQKIFAVPSSVTNIFGGALEGTRQVNNSEQASLENTEAYQKLKEMGYNSDGNFVYDSSGNKVLTPETTKLMVEAQMQKKNTINLGSLGTIAKESVKGFVNTYKSAFGDMDYSEVSDFSNVLNRQNNEEGDTGLISRNQTDKTLIASGLRALGVDDESAREWSNIGADIGMSMVASVADLNDVGKTIKYLNNADKVDDAYKVANNLDEALKLVKTNQSFDDFATSMKKTAEGLGKKIDDKVIKEAYDNFLNTSAQKLMSDTSKTIGGMQDFTGLKIGSQTLVSRETLSNISKNKLQKGLMEVGLSMYSPVGALAHGTVTNKIANKIGDTKLGSELSETIGKAFGGKNSQWTQGAKKAFKEGNYEDVMKNVNRKETTSIAKRFKEINESWAFKKHKEFSESGENLNDISKAMEGKVNVVSEAVETETINPKFVDTAKEYMRSELNKATKTSSVSEVSKLKKEIDELENIPKTSSINFKKELKSIGLSEHSKYFNEAISMSPSEFKSYLKSEGVKNAEQVADKIKTVANGVVKNIEENNPTLVKYLKGQKELNLNDFIDGSYWNPEDINSIDKQISKVKQQAKTYFEVEGKESEYFNTQLQKLEIAKDRLKSKPKMEFKEQVGEVKKAVTKETDSTAKELTEQQKKYIKKYDSFELENKKGADEITGGTVRTNEAKESFVKEESRLQSRRTRIYNDMKENGIELTSNHEKLIDGMNDEELLNVQKLINEKKQFNQTKQSFSTKGLKALDEHIESYEKLGLKAPVEMTKHRKAVNSYLTWFEKNGMEAPEDFKKGFETMMEFRKDGVKTPVFKFDKTVKDVEGKSTLLNRLVETGKVVNTKTDDEISKLATRIIYDKGLEKDLYKKQSLAVKLYDQLNDTSYGSYNIAKQLEDLGIKISPLSKTTLDDKTIKNIVKENYIGEYKKLVKNMSDEEIDIYKGLLSNSKMPPIDDFVKKEELKKIVDESGSDSWSKENMYKSMDENFKTEYDYDKDRSKWLAEQDERSPKKNTYDGTKNESNIYADEIKAVKTGKEKINDAKLEYHKKLHENAKKKLEAKQKVVESFKKSDIDAEDVKEIIPEAKTVDSSTISKLEKETKLESIKTFEPKVEEVAVTVDKPAITKVNNKTKGTPVNNIDPRSPKKLNALEFDVDGKKIYLDSSASLDDIKKVMDSGAIADRTIYTDKINAYGVQNKDTVVVNTKLNKNIEEMETALAHENTHYVQWKNNTPTVGGDDLKKYMASLPKASQERINRITNMVDIAGRDKTSEKLLRAKTFTNYIKQASDLKADKKLTVLKETDAVISSYIFHGNPEVRKLAREEFGDSMSDIYFKSIYDMGEKDIDELVDMTSKINTDMPVDELKRNLETINKVGSLGDEKLIKSIEESISQMDSIGLSNTNELLKTIGEYKDKAIDPEAYEKALKDIPTHIKQIDYISKVINEDLTGTLTEGQKKIYDEVKDYFIRYGKEEGIIKEGYEDLFSNYVFHMLNPEIKMNKKAYKLAREQFGASIGDVFNINKMSRKHKGTIEEINAGFNKTLRKEGLDEINLFETNISNIFLKRSLNHEAVMYNEKLQKSFMEQFGIRDYKSFSKEANTVDMLEDALKDLGVKNNIPELSKEFKESGQTVYRFLRENKDKLDVDVFDDDIFEYSTKKYAEKQMSSRFGIADEFEDINKSYNVYDMESKQLKYNYNESDYLTKKQAIENLKSKGLTEKDYVDNRALAEKKGLRYVDNDMVNVEAYNNPEVAALRKKKNKLKYELKGLEANEKSIPDALTKEYNDLEKQYRELSQNVRRELRDKYKADKSVHFAYSDIEINHQKAYRSMMDNMLSDGEYVAVTKNNGKKYTKHTTIKNENIEDVLGQDNFIQINRDDLRHITIDENTDDIYYFKKSDWNNYTEEVRRIKEKDKNAFLKIYDNALNVYKSMALGTGRFITNSAFGNFFESYMTSGVNLLNPKMFKKFLQYQNGEDIKIGKYSTTELKNSLDLFGVMETEAKYEYMNNPLYKQMKNISDEGTKKTPLQKLSKVNPFSQDFALYGGIRKAQNSIEEFSRFANVATHIENGKTLSEAINLTNKALFDYSDLSHFENDVMKRLVPFYTFMRNNIPLQVSNLQNNIGKTRMVAKIYDELNRKQGEKNNALRPDYLKDALPVGNNYFLNLPNPINDLEKLIKPSEFLQSLTPAIKTPLEIAFNKKFYSGSEVTKYDSNKDRVKYAIESAFPLFNSYGKAISKAKDGDFIQLANVLGVPLKTFDVEQAEQQAIYEYVDQLENQYYKFLEDNPEAKEYLAKLKEEEKTSKKTSKLSKLLK